MVGQSFVRSVAVALVLLTSLAPAALSGQERDRDWVLMRYIDAMGGRSRLNAINSVAIEGTLTLGDGREASIKVMKKRPNLVRTAILLPQGIRFVNGYDGKVAWKQTISPKQNIIEELDLDTSSAFIRDAALESPLAAEGFDRRRISYLGRESIEGGIECYRLRVDYGDGTYAETFLDTAEFYERKTVKHERIDGEMRVNTTFPSDFRFVNGVVFAYRVVMRDHDGSRTELIIDSIRVNVGALDSIFHKPGPGPYTEEALAAEPDGAASGS